MRRWVTAAALGCVAMLALAGCGRPGGVDGDLTDDWAPVANPVSFTPAAGTCHPEVEDVGYLSAYNPLDCGERHKSETLYVGTFTGADAARATAPPAGSPSIRTARVECDKQVNAAVGADYRSGRLAVSLVLPSLGGWTGGGRWYRCDVGEVGSLDDSTPVARTGSLKGALAGASNLAYGCFSPKLVKDDIDEMRPVPCTAKHRSEFAGIYQAPDTTYDVFKRNKARTQQGCMGVIATFAKVPNNSQLQYRAGSIYYYPNEREWLAGNRGVQCFLWLDDRDVTRSMKGAGATGLPVT